MTNEAMHGDAVHESAQRQGAAAPEERRSWWTGRSGLVVPLILAAFSGYLVVGIVTMQVPAGTPVPGPQFFPALLAIAGFIVAALLAAQYVRHPEPAAPPQYAEDDDVSDAARADAEAAANVRYRAFSDWESVAWIVGGFVVFAAGLMTVGWILTAAALFWCVARGMGSRRPLLDVVVALMMSSIAYIAFDVVLGLNLPSGVLGGL